MYICTKQLQNIYIFLTIILSAAIQCHFPIKNSLVIPFIKILKSTFCLTKGERQVRSINLIC